MSQDNAEVIRALYERWNQNDLLVFLEVLRPDAEFVNPPDAIEPGSRTGYRGFTAVAQTMSETFSSSSHEVLEVHAAGPHVIASVIFRAEGTGSGVSVEQPETHIWTFQDDKVSRFAWFRSEEDAAKALGSLE
jgi:ketosteroid isomerase-like protein